MLPFIDEIRLLEALEPKYPLLTSEEVSMNARGCERLYVSKGNRLYSKLYTLYSKKSIEDVIKLDPKQSMQLLGSVSRDSECIPETRMESPLHEFGMPDVNSNKSLWYRCYSANASVFFFDPEIEPEKLLKGLLAGVKMPPRILNSSDFNAVKSYQSRQGRGGGRGGGRGRGRGGVPRQWIPNELHQSGFGSAIAPAHPYYSNNNNSGYR